MGRRRYEDEPDDADELWAESHGKRHIAGPDCECHDCMTADDRAEEEGEDADE